MALAELRFLAHVNQRQLCPSGVLLQKRLERIRADCPRRARAHLASTMFGDDPMGL